MEATPSMFGNLPTFTSTETITTKNCFKWYSSQSFESSRPFKKDERQMRYWIRRTKRRTLRESNEGPWFSNAHPRFEDTKPRIFNKITSADYSNLLKRWPHQRFLQEIIHFIDGLHVREAGQEQHGLT